MVKNQNPEPELLFSFAKVTELMEISERSVCQAEKRGRVRSKPVMIDNKMRVAITFTTTAEH